jgi:hypothetical protein
LRLERLFLGRRKIFHLRVPESGCPSRVWAGTWFDHNWFDHNWFDHNWFDHNWLDHNLPAVEIVHRLVLALY